MKDWRKSSRCDTNACVEVLLPARGEAVVGVRDAAGRTIEVDAASWSGFVRAVSTEQLVP